MSRNTDEDPRFSWQRPVLTLDRENKKVLGVCAGFARYLDVPPSLVRVIYIVACVVSPFLILAYLLLYWLLEDEQRPGRIKAAMCSYIPGNADKRSANESSARAQSGESKSEPEAETGFQPQEEAGPARRFDLRKPLYRSRRNVRVGGVCAGIADYLNVNAFFVRLLTFISIFILGGITFWVYVICWIVLDKEPKSLQKSRNSSTKPGEAEAARQQAYEASTIQSCAERLQATEQRLRNAEAFITSRQFRLHCEINRI